MSGTRRKPGVKGHWNLPRGGRETCPVAVTRVGSGTHFVVLMLRVLPVGLASSG